jgi:hypothetical protein
MIHNESKHVVDLIFQTKTVCVEMLCILLNIIMSQTIN